MTKPLLQVALDIEDTQQAIEQLNFIADQVDIIEVGTILAVSQGLNAVRAIRRHFPHHLIVFDVKITDASRMLAQMAFRAGANWITVSAAAHIETIRAAQSVAKEHNGEVQIELYGHWTWQDVQQWKAMGIEQVIYHRSRDAELAGLDWSQADLDCLERLRSYGMQVSITGGITPDSLSLFKHLDVKAFIAGRALLADDGLRHADAFHHNIQLHW
ncbi:MULTISPECIES: 3-keto-L-gulonate-6-phosphate decarboxylase UlaD [unclassified Vibrio]|uniref:3-keto-L-gulonate-6-phosphate decarboxylase UlaD n=1 Tax=Vibrio sp. HB236076 TaxID=3232307 RepID=A0AB39HEY7_9VIBR|nr:3-keto-L-gulonate-6-phosphate decarboxylase UlaD [Vibrio sp. HB161653]MDP5255423.1 3-keto-L-gulonate-6-phosphate decarboxylase UlaD [Vibrio sp. HB161653]